LHLTTYEERILEGEYGWSNQIAMRILVKLGDLFGATKLIPVQSAHLSGVSYKHMGDGAIEFLNELAGKGGIAQIQATLNPSSFDPDYLVKRYSKERFEKQERILALYKKMMIQPTLTCTPYYIRKPKADQHLAWAESSAVVYANSVLKAWTNREGSPSALAAALIGKTPNYGMHQAENRRPNAVVKIEARMETETDYGTLGVCLGKLLKDKVPMLMGLQGSDDELKQLGAAMASSGMTSLFQTTTHRGKEKLESFSVEAKDMKEAAASFNTSNLTPDLVFVGCPHCSEREVKAIANILRGRKVRKDLEMWVCTSRHVEGKTRNYVDTIERAGARVLCDTCVLVSWIKDLGFSTVMTNSAKTAFYAPTLNDAEARLAPLKQCIQTACTPS
jgi:predicted aconitase